MDIIELAREIGRKLQEDKSYLNLQIAQQNSDEDKELQELIGEFNLKRMAINNEATKEERDSKKIEELNNQIRELYSSIMKNERMVAYNIAKNDFDHIVKRVNAIIMQSASGEDPNTADLEESGCEGNCSGCSGCH